jgi:hypothetical protein
LNAGFRWEQPEYLVLALAAACALAAYRWSGRVKLSRVQYAPGGGANVPAVSERPGALWLVRLVVALLAGAAAAVISAALTRLATSQAAAVAGALAAVAAAWLAAQLYRGRNGSARGPTYGLLVCLRILAAIVILAILARPVWDWVLLEWRKPILAVVLDQSQSMGIHDTQSAAGQSRADLVNAALHEARGSIARLADMYDVHVCSRGAADQAPPQWRIEPAVPFSALAAAVHEAGQLRGPDGSRPAAVLLVSDGAENVDNARALRSNAEALATQGTALIAVGAGPAPGAAHCVELDPLFVPARLGSRDRVRVPVTARVQNCRGAKMLLELLWNGQRVEAREVPVQRDQERAQLEFNLLPPGAGVQRLTARAVLPDALGGQRAEVHAVVEVRDDRIRVLYLEDTPHTESAFVIRALQADPRFELTSRFVFAEGRDRSANLSGIAWTEYDVVILGRLSPIGADASLNELATAVTHHGVGLLLAGGRKLFNDTDSRQSPLAALSPVQFVRDEFGLPGPLQFVPTRAGLQHPLLRGIAEPTESAPQPASHEPALWRALPPLGAGALLGQPKPLASVLARDEGGRTLLATQEIGTGRCVVDALESTWPWVLASDDGAALHRRLWGQMVLWLANRRPQAWVLTDQPSYSLAALKSGQAHVRVRAGVSGQDFADGAARFHSSSPRLELVNGEQRIPVRVTQRGEEWVAELSGPTAAALPSGRCQLEFNIDSLTGPSDGSAPDGSASQKDVLTARTEFALLETQLELEPPTSNLAALRSAGEATAEAGGGYWPVQELPKLLETLAHTDRRQEVRRPMRYALIESHAWSALLAAAGVLALEWLIRKRVGLP